MSNNKMNNKKNQQPNENEEFNWKKFLRGSIIWILLIMVFLYFSKSMPFGTERVEQIDYNLFLRLLEKNKIQEVEIDNQTMDLEGVLKEKFVAIGLDGREYSYQRFKLTLPDVDKNFAEDLVKRNIKVKFTNQVGDWWIQIIGFLPWLLLIMLMFMFVRRMQGGGGGKNIFNFGKSRAKLLMQDQTKVTFSDVAGCEEAKEELREIIEFLKNPHKFTHLGGRIPKGVLLLGPPGTGKTLLAKAVAGEAGVPFFSISGADFVEMFVGVGASRVRDLFEQGRKNAPGIIFIDEIDAVGRQRGAGLGGGHDEREQTLNQLLVEMDGFDSKEGLIIIAATNRPDVLDPALLRPGRFDRQVVVDRPDVKGREDILKVHVRKIPLDKDVDLKVIAKGTPGLSGADLANLVNEAALFAARKNKKSVGMDDFEEAKDKILMGVERRSLIISEEEKKITAYHESGHVLIAKLIPGSDPVHKVTIIPRGRALGVTAYLPIDERHNYTKKYCETMLAHLLGGRAAEKIVFNELTTGAGNDLERATNLARKMVCEWGMSDKLGPVTFGKRDQEIFLGREMATHREHSEKIQEEIDEEIRSIIVNTEEQVIKLLKENKEKLDRLATALLEYEILDAEEIDMVMEGKELKRKKNGKPGQTEQQGDKKEKAEVVDKNEVTTEEISDSNSEEKKVEE
ncbi:MAG: ATP-dependent zinc metalloprotease FtsH [Calditrichia bacterium]